MKKLFNLLLERIYDRDEDPELDIRPSASRVMPKPSPRKRPAAKPVRFESAMQGKIEDGGPGKNILVRNKYLREETGTDEKLKIVDDSILGSDDEDGIDPYNTGRFDRSKSWNSLRSRK